MGNADNNPANKLKIIRCKKRHYNSKLDRYRAELEALRLQGASLGVCAIFLKTQNKGVFRNIARSTISRCCKKWLEDGKKEKRIVSPSKGIFKG